MAASGISGGSAISRLFMTHPPLDERIEALRAGR
jgi:heat shock protein HtpX